jgi:hypothetical protein
LKPERWGSPLVQEKYQEEKVCDKIHLYRIIIIIIIIIIIGKERDKKMKRPIQIELSFLLHLRIYVIQKAITHKLHGS